MYSAVTCRKYTYLDTAEFQHVIEEVMKSLLLSLHVHECMCVGVILLETQIMIHFTLH